ncbi:hypothetical protein PF327_10715 [Sulfurovum sp. XTW-4]|uniref:LemA protein n=1 Tax=Sulfurovum xiamenensis TaxID=3019066 RepID=A0ABT7QUB5_9BACT|nr:hypothetical protein [Sulfurovum xiamenensis]MDM5264666.1 hypothetical protein [Sulfurovum xiamenensis]
MNKILIWVILVMLVSGIATIGTLYLKVQSQADTIDLRDQAIEAYEELIKVVPYNALAKERKDNANTEINATLSTTHSVSDGHYRM